MKKIEPPDKHYLSAAIGWLGLGNPAEARAELARIQPSCQDDPDVLEIRWLICAREGCWDEGVHLARSLVQRAPDRCSGWVNQAYSLRRAPHGGVRKAWEAFRTPPCGARRREYAWFTQPEQRSGARWTSDRARCTPSSQQPSRAQISQRISSTSGSSWQEGWIRANSALASAGLPSPSQPIAAER